jgi:hypothetical protein
MRTNALWIIAPLMLLAGPARAHFHLDAPPQATEQADLGDPQKPGSADDACPSGVATGAVTQVRAGDKIHVKITETVPHGGHYRVAFAADKSAFHFPQTTVTSNQCMSTTVSDPPALPVLADGLFEHDQTMANAGKVCNGTTSCETDVTVPANAAPGTYVLQVIEWMTPHGSAANNGEWGCFYAHCANVRVMESDATVPDGGVVVFEDAGTSGSNGSSGPSSPSDGNSSTSTKGSRVRDSDASSDGCNVSANGASLCAPLILALAAVRGLRRRRRASR